MYLVWQRIGGIASGCGQFVEWLLVHLSFPLAQLTLEQPVEVIVGDDRFVVHAFSMAHNRAKVKRLWTLAQVSQQERSS